MPGGHWNPPGRFTEPGGDQLAAFGFGSLPATRVNTDDPAVSKAQQRFFGLCLHGGGRNCPKGMTKAQMRDFAATKHRRLPEHVD